MKKTITVFHRRIPNPVPLFVSAALLISLFALSHFNQSTAWYMQNKDASANGMQVGNCSRSYNRRGRIDSVCSIKH